MIVAIQLQTQLESTDAYAPYHVSCQWVGLGKETCIARDHYQKGDDLVSFWRVFVKDGKIRHIRLIGEAE